MKLKESLRVGTALFCIAFIPIACGTNRIARSETLTIKYQDPVVVERQVQSQRPAWISEDPFFEDRGGFHCSGCFMGGSDHVLTIRLAKSEAAKNLLESIQIRAQAEFSTALHGQNIKDSDVGRYVTDAIAWTIDNLTLSGIRQSKIHSEEVYNPITQSYRYNAWVQLVISREDYRKAKSDAGKKLLDKAVREEDQEAKEKAMELLQALRNDV
jgi:hypothetical protein